MSEAEREVDEAEEIVRLATGPEGGDREELRARLGALPEGKARQLLQRVAREQGPQAVPLLEVLAATGPAGVDMAAVQSLGAIRDEAAASALRRLGTGSTRAEVRKVARREMHRLASLGISPRAPVSAVEEAKPATRPVYKALASYIDGRGNRGIWIGFDAGPEVELLALLVSDEKGILDVSSGELSRPGFDREARQVIEDREQPWVEMPVDYCRHLVEEAHARNAATRTRIPVEYLAWRDQLGRPQQAYPQPLIYSVLNAAEVRWDPRFLDASGSLFQLEMFQTWILEPEEIGEFLRERALAQQSGLVLTGRDPEQRDRMLVDRALQSLFDAGRRSRLRRRLEEMAYLLWKQDRGYQARVALAAAMALEPADRSLQNHPFARQMVAWSLEVLGEKASGERVREVKPGVKIQLPY